MRSVAFLLVGLLGGAGLYALGDALLAPQAEAPPPSAAAPLPAVQASDLGPVLVRLDRIERRLDDLASLPRADTPASATLKGRAEAEVEVPEAPTREAVAIDADALAEALEEVEARKWAALNDDELAQLAQRMAKQGNAPGARKALERLIARELEPEGAAKAWTQLGMLQRSTGDLDGSVRSLREAIRTVGLDSPQGVQAGMQLAWSLSKQEDVDGALRVAEDVIRSSHSDGQLRTNMRWGVGVLSAMHGDASRARREFESVIRDAEDDPKLEGLAKDARRRLEELR